MTNWTDYVRSYAEQKGISYSDAMKKAAPSYRKMYGIKKKPVGMGIKKRSSRSGSKVSMPKIKSRKMAGGKLKKRMGASKPIKKKIIRRRMIVL